MIDSSKLLPNRGTITLSKGSVKKVALIERKLILIDSLLKQKLLLSKVREGIRRQEEERIKRTQQELSLEKEDDDKDDLDSEGQRKRKPKDPKDGGGASLVGSALIGAAGVSLAKNAGLIIGAAKAATVLISGGIALGIGIAKVSNQFDNLQKSVASFGPAGSAAIKVSNAFLFTFKNFVSAAILVGIFNAVPESKLKIRRGLSEKIRNIGKKKVPTKVVLPEGEPNFVREIKKIKVKDRVNPKIRTKEKIFDRVGRKRKPSLIVGDKLREGITNIKGGKVDLGVLRDIFKLEQSVPVEKAFEFFKQNKLKSPAELYRLASTAFESENLDLARKADAGELSEAAYRNAVRENVKTYDNALLELSDYSLSVDEIFFNSYKGQTLPQSLRFPADDLLEKQRSLKRFVADFDDALPQSSKSLSITLDEATNKAQKSLSGGNNILNPLKEAPLDDFGIGGGNTISGPSFFNQRPTPLTSRQILSQQGSFNAPKIVNQITKNADNITNIKSLSGLLEAFGGIPLVKATRKFLGNTIGKIPILGDLLGFLLDVFVFKEPVGRAVFMAAGGALGGSIGAWLGGILGTAVPVVGNLAGAVVGGFLGGVGGDMLGGFLYDQIIGKQQKPQPISEKAIKSSTKGLSKLGLNGGGLVPNLAMQGGGVTPDVGSFASYEDPRGRVAVKTILLPLNSESDESNEAIVTPMGSSSRVSRYEKLYKGGLA